MKPSYAGEGGQVQYTPQSLVLTLFALFFSIQTPFNKYSRRAYPTLTLYSCPASGHGLFPCFA